MRRVVLALLPFCPTLAADPARDVEIPTPRGARLKATLHEPATPNGAAVVLAPGQGYHRGLPLMTACAEQLAAAGFVAIRFDWAYFTAKKTPAPDLSTESEDLDAAIAFARARDGVTKVIVAGKSLGSVAVLLRAERKSDDLLGVALLTLPVHQRGAPGEPFAEAQKVAGLKVPVLIVCGDKDDLCAPSALYALAASCPNAPSVAIVPGDHGFKEGNDPARERENVALVSHVLTVWARRRL